MFDKGIVLGYSTSTRVLMVFNKQMKTIMKSINVVINDSSEGMPKPHDDDSTQFLTLNTCPSSAVDSQIEATSVNNFRNDMSAVGWI